ncbi:MAG: hypothetical protein ACO3IW_13900 [Burkholderiales bacterium]
MPGKKKSASALLFFDLFEFGVDHIRQERNLTDVIKSASPTRIPVAGVFRDHNHGRNFPAIEFVAEAADPVDADLDAFACG